MLRLIGVILLTALTAACSGERGVSCEDSVRYASSTTIPPVRVPDDLTPPDESDALVVPQVPQTELSSAVAGECLESPPDFFEDQSG